MNEINQYKTPKKKIKILIDFCNIVSSMVCDNGSKGKLAGAEEVFPIIVYVIIKAKANKLKANLNFIRHFRHTSRLESEDDYYFTTISQAIQFLDDLTHQQLNISESEFISSIEESQKKDIIRKYNSCFANYHSKNNRLIKKILTKTFFCIH